MVETKISERSWLKQVLKGFSDHESTTMAASLAYYTIFSLPPLLVIVITIAGLFWGEQAVRQRVTGEIRGVVGDAGVEQIKTMMSAAAKKQRGTLATVIGVVVLLFGATGVVGQLQYALNRVWNVKPDPKAGGIWPFIHKRILSFAMILGVAFLLTVSLVLTTLLAAAGEQLQGWFSGNVSKPLLLALNFAVTLVVLAIVFAAMFRWLPDARTAWSSTLLGGTATAVLFIIGKFLLGLYLGRQDPSAYGPAAALVLILVWVYYSSIIVLLGAEFTRAWAERRGRKVPPVSGAVKTDESGNVQPRERVRV